MPGLTAEWMFGHLFASVTVPAAHQFRVERNIDFEKNQTGVLEKE